MDLDPELLKVLIDTFVIELDDQSQQITDGLLKLETGDDPNYAATIDAVFRAAHNIKGAARGVDLRNIGDIAHVMEDLFTRFKQDSITPPSHIIDACFKSIDYMGSIAKATASGEAYDENGINEFIEELHVIEKDFLQSLDNPQAPPPSSASPSAEEDSEAKDNQNISVATPKQQAQTSGPGKESIQTTDKPEEKTRQPSTENDKQQDSASQKPSSTIAVDKKPDTANEIIPVSLD